MSTEGEDSLEALRQNFEREVVEPTKKAMKEAMMLATSEEDAKQRIKDALPIGRTFIGPIVLYSELELGDDIQRSIVARVQTLDHRNQPVDIEESFSG